MTTQNQKPDHFEIAVIGLGYVGLSLSMEFTKCGFTTLGIDVDKNKIQMLKNEKSYLKHIDSETIKKHQGTLFFPTCDFELLNKAKNIIVCVPTPLTKQREPDLSFILDSGKKIGSFLKAGTLVVLESTTYPGTTEGVFKQELENASGLKAGVDFYLAYSPEREDPGNESSKVSNIPKVVGGFTEGCRHRALSLYSKIAKSVHPVSSCKTAEASKLLENIFRCVNIALVNELKVIYAAMGIDIWEVIEAAKTKPFGFMPFYPGPGLGGHCIPVDPFYLTWKAREFECPTRFIELAGEINWEMPLYVLNQTIKALNSIQKSVFKSNILLVGVSYKPGIEDTRESPALEIIFQLEKLNANIFYFDSYVPSILSKTGRSYQSIKTLENSLNYDAAIICTNHPKTPLESIYSSSKVIIDTRNCILNDPDKKLFKA